MGVKDHITVTGKMQEVGSESFIRFRRRVKRVHKVRYGTEEVVREKIEEEILDGIERVCLERMTKKHVYEASRRQEEEKEKKTKKEKKEGDEGKEGLSERGVGMQECVWTYIR